MIISCIKIVAGNLANLRHELTRERGCPALGENLDPLEVNFADFDAGKELGLGFGLGDLVGGNEKLLDRVVRRVGDDALQLRPITSTTFAYGAQLRVTTQVEKFIQIYGLSF